MRFSSDSLVERYLERSVYGLRVLMGDTDHRDSIDGHGDGHGSENGSETDLHEKHHRTDGTIPAYLTASTLESVRSTLKFVIACLRLLTFDLLRASLGGVHALRHCL